MLQNITCLTKTIYTEYRKGEINRNLQESFSNRFKDYRETENSKEQMDWALKHRLEDEEVAAQVVRNKQRSSGKLERQI